jgi:hypothetical protein
MSSRIPTKRRPRRHPERDEENAVDRLMAALGFTVVRFSQPKAHMQTLGWPDRAYFGKNVSLFWEAKALGGKRSFWQIAMSIVLTDAGLQYVTGQREHVEDWLVVHGYLQRISADHFKTLHRAD